MSAPIRVEGFEAVFAREADPWGTWERRDEAVKRGAILRACGHIRGRALELACGNGSNTAALRSKALRLLAVDGAPSAVSITQKRVTGPRVSVAQAVLPDETPRDVFDLIVIAEVLYYLRGREIVRLGARLRLAPGGRLVLAHHHIRFHDVSSDPAAVHATLLAALPQPLARVFHRQTGRWRVEGFAPR